MLGLTRVMLGNYHTEVYIARRKLDRIAFIRSKRFSNRKLKLKF